jgi:hypothetical protein
MTPVDNAGDEKLQIKQDEYKIAGLSSTIDPGEAP